MTDPPIPACTVRSYELREKVAEIVRGSDMLTVVADAFGSLTPPPDQLANEYPVSGTADMDTEDPW